MPKPRRLIGERKEDLSLLLEKSSGRSLKDLEPLPRVVRAAVKEPERAPQARRKAGRPKELRKEARAPEKVKVASIVEATI